MTDERRDRWRSRKRDRLVCGWLSAVTIQTPRTNRQFAFDPFNQLVDTLLGPVRWCDDRFVGSPHLTRRGRFRLLGYPNGLSLSGAAESPILLSDSPAGVTFDSSDAPSL